MENHENCLGVIDESRQPFRYSIAAAENPSDKEPVLLCGSFENSLSMAKEMGYQGLEIHVRDPLEVDLKSLKEACLHNDIQISGIATGLSYAIDNLNLIDDNHSVREKAIKRLKDFVNFAEELNSVILIGRMKGDIEDVSRYSNYEGVLADSLSEIAVYAEERKVEVMLEAINRYESNYMNTVGEVAAFIKKYKLPATKVLFDVFHMNIEEKTICESIKNNISDLGYFHVADSNRMYPGAGHIDISAIMEVLVELGYKGFVSLECMRRPDGERAARKAMEYFTALKTLSTGLDV